MVKLDLKTEDEINIPLPNGGYLRCDAGENHQYGGALRVLDADGNEVVMWDKAEWAEDPEGVIGAVFSYAATPLEEIRASLGHTRVEEGCWVTGGMTREQLRQEASDYAARLVAAGDLGALQEVFETDDPNFDVSEFTDDDLAYIYENYIAEE